MTVNDFVQVVFAQCVKTSLSAPNRQALSAVLHEYIFAIKVDLREHGLACYVLQQIVQVRFIFFVASDYSNMHFYANSSCCTLRL